MPPEPGTLIVLTQGWRILADQLTLSEPGRADSVHHITTRPPPPPPPPQIFRPAAIPAATQVMSMSSLLTLRFQPFLSS